MPEDKLLDSLFGMIDTAKKGIHLKILRIL